MLLLLLLLYLAAVGVDVVFSSSRPLPPNFRSFSETHPSLGASSLHALLDLLRLVVGEVAGPRGRQLLGHGVGVGGGYPVPGGRRCRRVGREGVKAAGGELAGGVGGRVVDVLRSGAGSRRRQRRVGDGSQHPWGGQVSGRVDILGISEKYEECDMVLATF